MKYLNSQKGSALLAVVGALSVLGIMGAVIGTNLEFSNETAVEQGIDLDTLEHLDKALSLASYFVTNNLVLCRDSDEGSWPSPIKAKCIWGGEKYSIDKSGKTIGVDFYKLKDISSDGKFILKIPSKHKILAGADNRSIEIEFEIKDFSKDSSLKKIIGSKDPKYDHFDQDNKIILISTEAKHNGYSAGKKSALIRRPFASPVLSVKNPPACNLVCTSGKSHNPYKECRSKNDVPRSYVVEGANGGYGATEEKDTAIAGENHITLTIRNDGPGAIYNLKFFKNIDFNKKNYPNMKDSTESVDVMANGVDILMPGKSVTYEDKIPCLPPTKKTEVRRAYGSRRTVVQNSVHKESYMELSYGFNFSNENSDITPRRLSEEISTDKVDVTRDVGVTKVTHYVSPPH